MDINIAWWNTNVSPPVRKKIKKKESSYKSLFAAAYIKKFATEYNVDFFALCEVSDREFSILKNLAMKLQMEFLGLSHTINKVIMDFAILFESSKLQHVKSNYITPDNASGSSLRIGVHVIFKEEKNKELIHMILSHWPANSTKKDKLIQIASRLRDYIDNHIYSVYGHESKIICVGDYNQQPYSNVITEHLESTKDIFNIKKRALSKLLYNPCWKLLSNCPGNNSGTYYHRVNKKDRWYVFDQLLFSYSLLSDNINEIKFDSNSIQTHFVFNNNDKVIDSRFIRNFDHFPIFGRLKYD